MKDLPRKVRLADETTVTFRLLAKNDEKALIRFYGDLLEEDRLLMQEDVTDVACVRRQCRPDLERVLPVAAVAKRRIVALGSLHRRLHGWSRHVGEIRIAVLPKFRRRGLALRLIAELGSAGATLGLEILKIEIPEGTVDLLPGLESLGFSKQVTMNGAVVDQAGKERNLVVVAGPTMKILTCFVARTKQARSSGRPKASPS